MAAESPMNPTAAGSAPGNPYVGPVPFSEPPLYGRKRETDELADLLVSKRIVLLFGPSGAGKTSLIQAALVPKLRDRYRLHALPTVRLTHRNDAVAGRTGANRYALSTMRSLEGRYPPEQQLSDADLAALTLGSYAARRLAPAGDSAKRQYDLLVLDQFEELFTLDPLDWDAKKAYLAELAKLLAGAAGEAPEVDAAAPPRLWALISMREDRVAELQPFLYLMPTAFAFRYRLDPLERDEALEAVTQPAGAYMTAEAAERLVDDLRTMRVRAPDGTEVRHQVRFVEPVQLQVVCRGLWDTVVATPTPRRIELADVTAGGGASEVDRALGDYFDAEVEKAANAAGVSQRNLRDWIEKHLITASDTRTQVLRLPASLGALDDAIRRLIDASLVASDLRGDREWIEIAHDRLIHPIRAGNAAWRDRNLQLFQRQAKLWADTGKAHRDMLFYREELSEAERFAAAHPDELDDDERQFLADSGRERERIAKEKKTRWMIFSAVAFALCLAVAWGASQKQVLDLRARLSGSVAELQKQEREQLERARLYQAVSSARDKSNLQALGELLKLRDRIAARPADNVATFFDSTLRETLRAMPRAVETQLGAHSHIVRAVGFTADGSRLLSGSWDGTIATWRLDKPGSRESTTEDQAAETYAVALHEPTGAVASSYINGTIVLWRLTASGLQKLGVLGTDRTGYRKQATTAVFNGDGTLLATAGWDKKILLWDVSDLGAPVRIASFGSTYHTAPIQRIVFLPRDAGGDRLASTDLDGKVRIWRIPARSAGGVVDPRPERNFAVSDIQKRNVGLYSAAVSPNGRYLVAGDSEGYVYVWDLLAENPGKSGVRLAKAHHGRDDFNTEIYDIAFSPDGREFASVGVDGVVLRWTLPPVAGTVDELRDRIEYLKIGSVGERLYSVAYHPSRAGVIAVGGTRAIQLVDLGKRGSLLAAPLVPGDQSTGRWRGVAMDAAATTIAAARADNRIFFWRRSADGIIPVQGWTIDTGGRTMFALHPTGSSVATLACGGKLVVWQLQDGGAPAPTTLDPGATPAKGCPVAAPSFSQDGAMLATALGARLEVWVRGAGGGWERQYAGTFDGGDAAAGGNANEAQEATVSLAFSAASDLLAAGGSGGHIRLLEIRNGKPAASFRPESVDAGKDVLALAFKPDGTRLVSGGEDGIIIEWLLPRLRKEKLDTRHERSVTSIAFAVRGKGTSAQRQILVSADREGVVREWTSGTIDGPTVLIAPASGHPVQAIAFGADGTLLATASDELLVFEFGREAMIRAAQRALGMP